MIEVQEEAVISDQPTPMTRVAHSENDREENLTNEELEKIRGGHIDILESLKRPPSEVGTLANSKNNGSVRSMTV